MKMHNIKEQLTKKLKLLGKGQILISHASSNSQLKESDNKNIEWLEESSAW